jgi:hypothetical protein
LASWLRADSHLLLPKKFMPEKRCAARAKPKVMDNSCHLHCLLTAWQIQKFVRPFSIRDSFEVFVGVQLHGDDYVKSSAASPLHVEQGYPVLDLCNGLVCVSDQ